MFGIDGYQKEYILMLKLGMNHPCSWCKGTGRDTEVTCIESERNLPFQ